MAFPPTIGTGSTGEFPVEKPRREPPGSSIVNLIPEANPDERPTIIGGPRPVQPMELVAGQKLGHFELLDAIGRGGMATVIKARDLELARIVALKILPPETARDPEVVSRFKQEARAAAMLDHENIARVYFCGEDRGLQFIAFEFVAGDNLRVVIERDGRLSPATAVRYMLQVATGLMHAAQRGVVHRDIKPSNIIITPDGQAKIVDMGLARLFDSVAVNGGVTQSGVTLGTFDYISPEQALDPRRADLRSDIYSLGCTFYHALTGQPPVPEGTAAKKLHAHQYDSPLDPRDLNPAVPEALAAVLAKMMAKDPARRYATAEELIADLQAVSMQCGFTLEMPPLEGAMQRPVPTLSEPNLKLPLPWLLAGSAAVIALAILFGRPSANAPTAPPWGETASSKSLPIENAPAANAAVPGDPANKAILTVPQFADALKAGDAVTLKLRPGTTFDFAALSEALTFSGSSLTIEAESGGTPPVLKLDVDRGLIFRGCRQVTLRGLDFQAQSAEEPGTEVRSAVECDGVNRISILGCRWHANVRGIAGAKIHSESACEVIVQNSLFDLGSGSTAFLLAATAKAEFRDSAFAAHQAAIEILPGEAEAAAGEVKLANCTFLLDRGAAIRASADTPVKISAEFCLFAAGEAKAPDVIMPGDLRPAKGVVLQLDGGATPEARFAAADHPNGYFEVAPLVLDGKAYSFADCPATIFNDAAARLLTRWPWAVSDPRPLVNGSDPAVAFRLNLSDARLRLPPASAAVILGAKVLGNAETHIYPGAWPPERAQAVKAAGNERIVWPEAEAEDAALRLYPNFAAAYAFLQPGETLSLAVNGPVPVPPLPEKALRGTIRASAGFKPVLVPEGAAFTTDAMLFRLAEGDLTFDGLEISLKDRQGIVSVAGGATCTFRRCVLTVHVKEDAPAAAVVFPDPAREMKGAPGMDEPPRVLFADTIIRGEGRAIWVQAARSFDVSFDNAAVALDDNLIFLEAPERAVAGEAPKGRLHLKRSTVVLGDSAIAIKAGRSAGGVPAFLALDAEACLFAAADARSSAASLVIFDDVDPMADAAKFLAWSGRGTVFAYADSAAVVEWRNGGDGTNRTWDWPQWLRFTRDEGKHVPRVRFARGSLKAKIASVEAADFALSVANPLEAGVDVERLAK